MKDLTLVTLVQPEGRQNLETNLTISFFFSCFSSLPMCYRFSHRANFQRATYPSSPLISSAGSRASHHTSWLSSPLCSLYSWEISYQWMFLLMGLRKPEEYENFFPQTHWKCLGCTLLTFCFLSPHFFFVTLVFLSFSKELRDGPNQNQSYLTIFLLYFYLLEFYFNVWWCSDEKSGCLMNKNEWRSGWPFPFICLLMIVTLIFFFLFTRTRCHCITMAKKIFQHIIMYGHPRPSFL